MIKADNWFFFPNPIRSFFVPKRGKFSRKLRNEAISVLHYYYLDFLQSFFFFLKKNQKESFLLQNAKIWSETGLCSLTLHLLLLKFSFLQKLYMKNYENYSYIGKLSL